MSKNQNKKSQQGMNSQTGQSENKNGQNNCNDKNNQNSCEDKQKS